MDRPQPSFFRKHWKLIVGLLLVLAVIGGIMQKRDEADKSQATNPQATTSSPTPAPAPVPVVVSARDLYAAYESNEVAADEKYKGKILDIQGKVENIGKDIANTMYVSLNSEKAYSFTNVQCMFTDEHKDALSKLKKGQKVTLRGRGEGKFGNVLIRDCSILNP